jgi:CoA:oxalate CoA-transferase
MAVAGPLSGITVIDLTRVLAGPISTLILADLGARVIKIESPEGEVARRLDPLFNGKSGYYLSVNRGKESMALDLKLDADRAIFEGLLKHADVLAENFRPGVMEKLGYGWETLHESYPRLIYAATSGFGHTGPYTSRAAYDMVAQGMGGLMSITGHAGAPPTRVGSSIGDITAGLFTAIGVNAAIYHRTNSGKGMKIDVAMLDCQVAILENAIVRYLATGVSPEPLGARHPAVSPFDAFATADRHIILAIGEGTQFTRLCQVLKRPDLADNPLFADNSLRVRHQAALKDEIESALKNKPSSYWLEKLYEARLPCGPINNIEEIVGDPQVAARNMIVEVEDGIAGRIRLAGNPIKLSAFNDPHLRPTAPNLDEDRERILKDFGL